MAQACCGLTTLLSYTLAAQSAVLLPPTGRSSKHVPGTAKSPFVWNVDTPRQAPNCRTCANACSGVHAWWCTHPGKIWDTCVDLVWPLVLAGEYVGLSHTLSPENNADRHTSPE